MTAGLRRICFRFVSILAIGLCWTPAMAATITVTTSLDALTNGDGCSLREAIINANNNDQSGSTDCVAGTGTDQIVFDPSTDGSPIFLSIQGDDSDSFLGDLDITQSLTISGNGIFSIDPISFDPSDARTVIDATNLGDRVMSAMGGTVVLERLAIVGGNSVSSGAGLLSSASSVTIRDSVFAGNRAFADGATARAGAIWFSGGSLIQIENSLFIDNAAEAVAGSSFGGAIEFNLGSGSLAIISQTVFQENTSSGELMGFGGAIYASKFGASSGAELRIADSIFRENIAIDPVDNDDNDVDRAWGGALRIDDIVTRIDSTTFMDNTVESANHVTAGGAIAYVSPNVEQRIKNSTFFGNLATSPDFGQGGALALIAGQVPIDLQHVTITGNLVSGETTAAGGGVVSISVSGTGDRFRTANTIIAANVSSQDTAPDCFADLQSIGYTLIGNNFLCAIQPGVGDQVGDVSIGDPPLAPVLASPGDNGHHLFIDGRRVVIPTIAPLPGSPAIDRASLVVGTADDQCRQFDQRGVERPIDGDGDGNARCDKGAVEAPAPTFELEVLIENSDSGSVASDPAGIDCPVGACRFSYQIGTIVELTATAAAGGQFFGWGGDCSGLGTCTLTLDADRTISAIFGSADAVFINGFE